MPTGQKVEAQPMGRGRGMSESIWLARSALKGRMLGLLITRVNDPVAFVVIGDTDDPAAALRAAKLIQRNNGFAARPCLHGCRVRDLREMLISGRWIDVPAFLLGAVLNPVDDRGSPDADQCSRYVIAEWANPLSGALDSFVLLMNKLDRWSRPMWMHKKGGKPADSAIASPASKSDKQCCELVAA
jgi:hypothetical protein